MRLMEHWWPALMGAGEGSRTVYHEGYRAALHGLHQACRAYSHYFKTQNCFFKNEWVLSQYSALNCRGDLPGWCPFTLYLVKTVWFFMGKLPLFLGEILSLGRSSRVGHPGNYILLATVTGSGMGMWPDRSEGNSVLGNSWKKRNSVEGCWEDRKMTWSFRLPSCHYIGGSCQRVEPAERKAEKTQRSSFMKNWAPGFSHGWGQNTLRLLF